MDAAEILKQAWASVEASGVPEHLQETALREAVAILRDQGGSGTPAPDTTVNSGAAGRSTKPAGRRVGSARKAASPRRQNASAASSVEVPDEDTFFGSLANASGVEEATLRDIIQLTKQGAVVVTPPTRLLGTSKAAQARNVVALVAPARLHGLGEKPISAEAVRSECARKDCFDQGNFGAKVIGALSGVNYGATKAEMVLAAKWVNEFQAAAAVAHGESAKTGE